MGYHDCPRLIGILFFRKSLIALYGFSLLFLGAIALTPLFHPEITLKTLTGDPVATLGGHQFTGVVSNIGVLFWSIAATVCLFSYTAFAQNGHSRAATNFLLWSGLFTSVLLIDDLFMLHENASSFHVSEKLMLLTYLLILLLYLSRFRKVIFQKRAILFWNSLVFFGFSVMIDSQIFHIPFAGIKVFFEDAFKFLGIVSWTVFLIDISFRELMALLTRRNLSGDS